MTTSDPYAILGEGPGAATRDSQLVASADALTARRSTVLANPRLLLGIAAGLMTLGISLILVGWLGASHSIRIEEQVPYLISGGLVGVALAIIGSVCLLAHWLTVLIRHTREGQQEILTELRAIAAALEVHNPTSGRAPAAKPSRPRRAVSRRE